MEIQKISAKKLAEIKAQLKNVVKVQPKIMKFTYLEVLEIREKSYKLVVDGGFWGKQGTFSLFITESLLINFCNVTNSVTVETWYFQTLADKLKTYYCDEVI